MRIAVVGTGYVGLVAGTCFAETGHSVTCVDVDEAKVQTLRRGETPIYEPGLEELLGRNIAAERISFTADLPGAVRGAEVVFIAVGTPSAHDGSADVTQVLAAAESIGRALARADTPSVIVTKSTVPVGTTDRVRGVIASVTTQPFAVGEIAGKRRVR